MICQSSEGFLIASVVSEIQARRLESLDQQESSACPLKILLGADTTGHRGELIQYCFTFILHLMQGSFSL